MGTVMMGPAVAMSRDQRTQLHKAFGPYEGAHKDIDGYKQYLEANPLSPDMQEMM